MERENAITSDIKSENTYFSTISGTSTIVNFNINLNIDLGKKKKHILIALDKSGSMAGSKMNECKKAIKEIASLLHSSQDNPNLSVICFDNSSTLIDLKGKTLQQCNQIIDTFHASGGTNFIPVFELIKKIVENDASIQDLVIIFMSDGQAESLDQLKGHIAGMKAFISQKLSSSELHSLGFGTDHDARLLEGLTKSMAADGTFQYIRESSEIQSSLDALVPFLFENRLIGTLKLNGREFKVVFKGKKDQPGSFEAMSILDVSLEEFEKLLGSVGFTIKVGDAEVPCQSNFVFQIPSDTAQIMGYNFNYLNAEVKKLTDLITSSNQLSSEQSKAIEERLAQLKDMQNAVIRQVFKLKVSERESAMESNLQLTEYIDKVSELLRNSNKGGLTNDQIASVNALAYRSGLAKNKLKVLDKRLSANVGLMNEVKENVQKAASSLNQKELEEKYKELCNEIGTCPLSMNNFIEAMIAEDCLCMTLDIGRPEVAITDASKLIIKKIHPSFVCASSFLDSVKYKLNLNVDSSGLFQPSISGEIVKGAANESITAAIPIFITPEHWRIASEYMKPIIAWDVTIDPLGYDYNQIRTVPFLVLERANTDLAANPESEHCKRIYELILDTCINILKKDKELVKQVQKVWVNYATDGPLRAVEEVQSNSVFLSQVHCLEKMNEIPKVNKDEFLLRFRYLVEEEMRRRQRKEDAWTASYVKKSIKNLINMDTKTLVEKLEGKVDSLAKNDSKQPEKKIEIKFEMMAITNRNEHYKKVFKEAKVSESLVIAKTKSERVEESKINQEKNEEKDKEKNSKFRFTITQSFFDELKAKGLFANITLPVAFGQLEGYGKELSKETYDSYVRVIKSFRGWLISRGFDLNQFDNIEALGITTSYQILALGIQNKIHHKNVDRVESFKSNDYADPYKPDEAERYIAYLVAQLAKQEYVRIDNVKPKDANYSDEDIAFMAITEDLEACAGMLVKNFDLGSLEKLQNILRTQPQNCKLVYEKLLMIRNKEYQGKGFEMDFKMRKKFIRSLYTRYKDVYKHDDWKNLWYKDHSGKMYTGQNTNYQKKGNKGVRGGRRR